MLKVNLVYITTSKPSGDTQQDHVKEGKEEVKEGGKKRRQQSDISVTQSKFKMLTEEKLVNSSKCKGKINLFS